MNKNSVVYVGPVQVQGSSAAARRILGNAKAIQYCGYDVVIASAEVKEDKWSETEGIPTYHTGERKYEDLNGFRRYLAYAFMGKETIQFLEENKQKIQSVILYSGYSPYLFKLLPWCKKNKIPLVFDAVEWYEAPNKLQQWFNPYYWNIELAMRYLIPKSKNVIAISSYLDTYYKKKGCITVIIPPLLSVSKQNIVITKNSKQLKLAYTGTPGRKDLFNNFLETLLLLSEDNITGVSLTIAGMNEDQVLEYPAFVNRNIRQLPDNFIALGYLSSKKAKEVVEFAHFSLLLRENSRVAQAGFPTKVVESLSVGTPVISNLTSDLDQYLVHRNNALVCDDYSVSSLKNQVINAQKMSQNEYEAMSENARITTNNNFSSEIRSKFFKSYLSNLKIIE